jgi:hypothetical protein
MIFLKLKYYFLDIIVINFKNKSFRSFILSILKNLNTMGIVFKKVKTIMTLSVFNMLGMHYFSKYIDFGQTKCFILRLMEKHIPVKGKNMRKNLFNTFTLILIIISTFLSSACRSSGKIRNDEKNNSGAKTFVTVWKIINPGTSADNQITLPLAENSSYNFIVN